MRCPLELEGEADVLVHAVAHLDVDVELPDACVLEREPRDEHQREPEGAAMAVFPPRERFADLDR